jgi:hypothetical protein
MGDRPGPALASEPKGRRRPVKCKTDFSKFHFQTNFKYQFSNPILSKKMTSFENGSKIKVA